jgi:biopolymer transport protein ExbD
MSRHRKMSSAESKIYMPITPMLDMTFQLLFFFIINFHPADLEGQMDMALPSEDVKAAHKDKEVDPKKAPEKDPTLEFPADLTVKVRTQQDENSQGGISAIFVRNIEGKEEIVNGLEGLRRYLEEKRGTLTNKEAIKVLGDSKLRVKHVMKVMDVCRKAGFQNVSFVPPEDFGR